MSTLENRPNKAVLVIDVQNGVVAGNHERDAVVANINTVVGKARAAGVPVVWIQDAGENPEVALPVNRIFEQRLARLQQVVDGAVARGELPPVDGYFLAEMLTGPVHLYVSRGLRPFTRAEAERITDVVLAGLRHTAE